MRPTKKIEKLISNINVTPDAQKDKKTLDDILNAQEKTKTKSSANTQPNTWRIIMQSKMTKFAAAAVIILVGMIIVNQFGGTDESSQLAKLLNGPLVHTLADDSQVELAEGASIRLYESRKKRGFEHLTGQIEVTVAKGKGEFVVTTSFGDVKALGTVFEMDLVNTDLIDMLAVDVKEGSVEVSNPQGSSVINASQGLTVERDTPPYDFRQDEKLPARLKERIDSMLKAIETGDKKAYCANYNFKAFFDLIKGNIKFEDHRNWFSGMSDDDAKRIIEGMANVKNPEEVAEMMLSGISDKRHKLYVRGVTLSANGQLASADCVERRDNRMLTLTPQWTYFRGDWWQTDD